MLNRTLTPSSGDAASVPRAPDFNRDPGNPSQVVSRARHVESVILRLSTRTLIQLLRVLYGTTFCLGQIRWSTAGLFGEVAAIRASIETELGRRRHDNPPIEREGP